MRAPGSNSPRTLENYLLDLVALILEDAREAKRERDAAKKKSDRDFHDGRLAAYREVISLMQNQAAAFGISLDSIGLNKIDPEKELV
jgi:hypothetical protein